MRVRTTFGKLVRRKVPIIETENAILFIAGPYQTKTPVPENRCRGFVFVGYNLKGERGISRSGGIGSGRLTFFKGCSIL